MIETIGIILWFIIQAIIAAFILYRLIGVAKESGDKEQ